MNESTQLDKLNGLIGHIKGQIDILEDIAIAEEGGDEHVFADDNRIKRSVYGAIGTMAAEAGSIVDWLQNREEENKYPGKAIDDILNHFFDEEAGPEQMVADEETFKGRCYRCEDGVYRSKPFAERFTASSCHDYGTEPLSDTVTKEKPCGYTIVGPDNEVRFRDISKTFVRMIRDSDYAQTEQLWVMKEGLYIPGVVGIMKIEKFK